MQTGIIGTGSGAERLAAQLQRSGYEVIIYDPFPSPPEWLLQYAGKIVSGPGALAERVQSKRILWMMIADASARDEQLDELQHYLSVGDIMIDGEPAPPADTVRRAERLRGLQIDLLDVALLPDEGNIEHLYISGNRFAFNHCESLLRQVTSTEGYWHCGRNGAGHFIQNTYDQVRNGTLTISAAQQALQQNDFPLKPEVIATIEKMISMTAP